MYIKQQWKGTVQVPELSVTNGELPITLIRLDRSVIPQQRTPGSTIGLPLYHALLECFDSILCGWIY
jgi:hypothetical protein